MEFPKPCGNNFETLCKEEPFRYLEWIRSDTLKPTELTFALEVLGHINSEYWIDAKVIFWRNLHHSISYVREGAIYGLQQIMDDDELAEQMLQYQEKADPDERLRDLITDVLSW